MKNFSEKRINELLKAERKLNALESAGVDNWEGFDYALAEVRKEDEIEEVIREFVERDLHENYLVEDVEVDWPAGMEAGVSVNITQDGIEDMIKHLLKIYEDIKEIDQREVL